MANSVDPNILIMLDNSGSMNEAAYSDDFGGNVSDCGTATARLLESRDDAEESLDDDSVRTDTTNLYLGEGSEWVCTRWWYSWCISGSYQDFETMVGLRFRNVEVPPGAVITNAYITVRAYTNGSGNASFTIRGEDVGDASRYEATNGNISNRADTAASQTWSVSSDWYTGGSYNTPDLSAIVSEIVNRGDWDSGNAMAFTFKAAAGGNRSIRSWNYGDHNSGPVLVIEYDAVCDNTGASRYYGYFDPDSRYSYNDGFVRDPSGEWDGNWLNWLCMRKIDVARKVLMGGLDYDRSDANHILYGEDPSGRAYTKLADGTGVSPYNGNYYFGMADGYIYVDNDSYPYSDYYARYQIKVTKDMDHEPQDFVDGKIGGILQRVGDRANWGNAWFNTGTGGGESGGYIDGPIGSAVPALVEDLQNKSADTWTPLAESFYVATQYFKQENVASGMDYPSDATGPLNDIYDPYVQDGEEVWCSKSFVILLTDGASTMDSRIPSDLRDLADGHETFLSTADDGVTCSESTYAGCEFPSAGTDYLKDVAHYARTTDLRNDIDGEQNITLYTVYAFGDDDNARNLLKEASRQGGFEDRNGNGWPDGLRTDPPNDRKEWDDDGDGVPDTYYEASDGYALEAQL